MNTATIVKDVLTTNFSFPASVVAPLAVRIYSNGVLGAIDEGTDGNLYETRYPNAQAFCEYYETMFTRDRNPVVEAAYLMRKLQSM